MAAKKSSAPRDEDGNAAVGRLTDEFRNRLMTEAE